MFCVGKNAYESEIYTIIRNYSRKEVIKDPFIPEPYLSGRLMEDSESSCSNLTYESSSQFINEDIRAHLPRRLKRSCSKISVINKKAVINCDLRQPIMNARHTPA